MARNYFILLISFLGAVALADYAIVTGLVNFQTSVEKPQSPDSSVLYKLAQKYEAGVEVEQDMDKAIYWYQVAAENGNDEAKNRLAALNIPLNKPSASLKDNGNTGAKNTNIDQEAQKITKLLEKQLAHEEEKIKKAKQNKKQENTQKLQHRLTEEKKTAERIRQTEEAKFNDVDELETDTNLNSDSKSTLDNEVATFEPQSEEDFDDDDVSDTSAGVARKTDSANFEPNSQIPLALQPARPLNLPSTQNTSTSVPNNDSSEYITAYDEEADIDIDNEEFSKPRIKILGSNSGSSIQEKPEEEKKEFNVNPCNGPAAKFMSTCR